MLQHMPAYNVSNLSSFCYVPCVLAGILWECAAAAELALPHVVP